MRFAVKVSTDIFWPAPHVGWAVQLVSRWLTAVWYVCWSHALHERGPTSVSTDIFWPAPHVGCVMQLVSRWLVAVWNVCWSHALQVRFAAKV